MSITDEKIKVTTPIQVSNLDRDVDTTSIWRELNSFVKELSRQINIEDLGEWSLLVSVLFRPTSGIGVYKRTRRYPSDKEFVISISISIPDDDQVHYGLAKVKEDFYLPLNEKNFHIIMPDFENYDDLYNYMLESSKLAIESAFNHGVTCGGKKNKKLI